MELGSGDDFSQLLHVRRLDVDNVEALILNVEIPKIDTEVVTADKGLTIAVDRDAVDVVCVRVGVHSPGYGGDDSVVVGHAREGEVCDTSEMLGGIPDWSSAVRRANTGWSQLLRQVVLRHNLQRLLKDLP